MGRAEPVACESFLVGGTREFVLVDGTESSLFGEQCGVLW